MKGNIELKIYELLGVKFFRKMAFFLRDTMAFPLTLKMNKDERRKFLYSRATNYNVGGYGLEDFKKFKKQLLSNALIHIWALSVCIPNFLSVINGTASLATTIINLSCIGINLYCIMLQRYNHIRINQVIEKMKPREEKKKNLIKEELKKEDQLLKQHSYKIVNKHKKEQDITFDELLSTASLQQLRDYREHLIYFKNYCNFLDEHSSYADDISETSMTVPIEKNKTLKLELKINRDKTEGAK